MIIWLCIKKFELWWESYYFDVVTLGLRLDLMSSCIELIRMMTHVQKWTYSSYHYSTWNFTHMCIPNNFIGLLVMKNRLSTNIRQVQWGFNGDSNSIFCRRFIESIDFYRSYTSRIWEQVMALCLVSRINKTWEDLESFCIDNLKDQV